jgi:hypothetical protein
LQFCPHCGVFSLPFLGPPFFADFPDFWRVFLVKLCAFFSADMATGAIEWSRWGAGRESKHRRTLRFARAGRRGPRTSRGFSLSCARIVPARSFSHLTDSGKCRVHFPESDTCENERTGTIHARTKEDRPGVLEPDCAAWKRINRTKRTGMIFAKSRRGRRSDAAHPSFRRGFEKLRSFVFLFRRSIYSFRENPRELFLFLVEKRLSIPIPV